MFHMGWNLCGAKLFIIIRLQIIFLLFSKMRLAELIVNIQFTCQKHYFCAMAVKYFDDKTRDAAVNHQRQQKTIDAFNRLPEEFTAEDVKRCFNLATEASARAKISLLVADSLVKREISQLKKASQKPFTSRLKPL